MIWSRLLLGVTRRYRCRQFVEAVTDYLEDTMSRTDRARFEQHLSRCDGCERYLVQIRRTIDLTGRITAADIDLLGTEARERLLGTFREFHTQNA